MHTTHHQNHKRNPYIRGSPHQIPPQAISCRPTSQVRCSVRSLCSPKLSLQPNPINSARLSDPHSSLLPPSLLPQPASGFIFRRPGLSGRVHAPRSARRSSPFPRAALRSPPTATQSARAIASLPHHHAVATPASWIRLNSYPTSFRQHGINPGPLPTRTSSGVSSQPTSKPRPKQTTPNIDSAQVARDQTR